MEEFTDDELHRIIVAFMAGSDDTFYGLARANSDRLTGFCVWCHHRTDDHAPNCEGLARLALAAKAKRIRDARKG